MYNSNDFVKLMKKAATEAVNASKPANMVFGKVISESPLKIKVDQKLILTKAQLVLTRNVTDYEVEIEPSIGESPTSHWTEENNEGEIHKHEIKGKKKMLIYNHLTTGEEVILMQVSGGQKYIVIDRIGKG